MDAKLLKDIIKFLMERNLKGFEDWDLSKLTINSIQHNMDKYCAEWYSVDLINLENDRNFEWCFWYDENDVLNGEY